MLVVVGCKELKKTHGDDLGGNMASSLFLAWMNAFDARAIQRVIEYQWLILDDMDGVVSNGTPNDDDIIKGFTDQGFPTLTMPPDRVPCQ